MAGSGRAWLDVCIKECMIASNAYTPSSSLQALQCLVARKGLQGKAHHAKDVREVGELQAQGGGDPGPLGLMRQSRCTAPLLHAICLSRRPVEGPLEHIFLLLCRFGQVYTDVLVISQSCWIVVHITTVIGW